ncbi:MAG: hypothetical protein L3J05_02160 [Robiginitomaculum sp.]|nr:hypothetical protein [Robiginitomaculum sp.]
MLRRNFRKIVVLSAVSQFLLLAGALATERTTYTGQAIQLICALSSQSRQDLAEFETEFCGALHSYLIDDLKVEFLLVQGAHEGRLVKVNVRLRAQSAAIVHINTGYMQNGVFAEDSSSVSSLVSYDQPLSVFSSRTLVRGIGSQLELIP